MSVFKSAAILGALAFTGVLVPVAQLQAQPGGSPDKDSLVSASLIADTTAVKPGQPFTVGVLFKMQPGWHIYYKNPGESGFATTVKWNIPDSASISETLYPAPITFESPGEVMSYGYEGETLLMAEVNLAKAPADGKLVITAPANWLMCSDRCIPNKKELTLTLPAGDGQPANQELFAKYKKQVAKKAGELPEAAKVKTTADGSSTVFELTITPPAGKQIAAGGDQASGRAPFFYPNLEKGYVFEAPKATGKAAQAGALKTYDGPVTIKWKTEPEAEAAEPLKRIDGVVVYQTVTDGKLDEPLIVEVQQKL